MSFGAPLLNMRGMVGSTIPFSSSTSDISGLKLVCTPATSIASTLVTKSETADGVLGAKINLSADALNLSAYSFTTNGLCELCCVGMANASMELSDDSLAPQRRICQVDNTNGLTIPSSGSFTDVVFTTYPGYVLSGHVYNQQTNPLASGKIYVQPGDDTDPNLNGYYEFLLPAGTYQIGTKKYDNQGYVNQTWPSNITVAASDISCIDFYLSSAATISGRVLANDLPFEGARIEAGLVHTNSSGNLQWDYGVVSTDTDSNGAYAVFVPPGMLLVINARPPDSSGWARQYYSNAIDVAHAKPLVPLISVPTTNINFNLQQGAAISGRVLANDIPLQGIEIQAGLVHTNSSGNLEWDDSVAFGNTDSNGAYTVFAPPGVLLVIKAQTTDNSGWLQQYYSNAMDVAHAKPLVPLISAPTTNINFNLMQGGQISGRVLGNSSPLNSVHIEAGLVHTNSSGDLEWDHGIAWADTDPNGFYFIVAPPGTPLAINARPADGSGLLEQYYSNSLDVAHATLVMPIVGVPSTNINFNLQAGAQINGRVTDIGGSPLGNINVEAAFAFNNNWNGGVAYATTDSNGWYSLVVAPNTNYYVGCALSDNKISWMSQYYSNVVDLSQAKIVSPLASSPATNINFALMPAMIIEGWILDASNHPLRDISGQTVNANVQVGARDGGGNWIKRWETWSDSNGYYRSKMEAWTNHIVRVSDNRYHEVYFQDKLSISAANAVSSAQGVAVSNVNFRLYDPTADSDFDSIPDYIEGYITGTDPFNSNDCLRCTGLLINGGLPKLSWCAVNGKVYNVERSTNLLNGASWTNLTPQHVAATSTNASLIDSNAPPNANYRVLIPY